MCPLMLLECLLFVAAAPPEPSPIHLPTVRDTVPAPMPADAAVTLTPDVLYVFQSDVPCLTFTSPGGAVGVTKAPGPLTIHSKFADSPGEPRLQTFDKKYVYLVKSLKDGRDELIIVPVGATDEGAARRVTFQVGQMPQPPPGPGPKPPEPKPVAKEVWLVLVEESGQRTVGMAAVVNELLRNGSRLTSAGITYRTYDRDSELGKHYAATAQGKGVSLPAALVIDKAAKDGAEPLGVFPVTTFADLEAKTKPFVGGK